MTSPVTECKRSASVRSAEKDSLDAKRIKKDDLKPNTYYIIAKATDSIDTIFQLFETFANSNGLIWAFKYDHQNISTEETDRRYQKQLNDFKKAVGLNNNIIPGQKIQLTMEFYNNCLLEQNSIFPIFPPLRQKLEGTGLLVDHHAKPLPELQSFDEENMVAEIDFSLREEGRSWDWKLAEPLKEETIAGLKVLSFNSRPYFDQEHPELGGDLHGVSGGITKQFPLDKRPDLSSATHYVFYMAVKGENSFFVSVEFFDYDLSIDPDHDGFSNNPNNLARNWSTESEEAYKIRYDREFMQRGFEQSLLQLSGGLVDEYEFTQHRYDGYRYREYGADGPKAQKILFEADPNKKPLLYRVQLPINAEFMTAHYINTAVGDGQINFRPFDLQRIQYVLYVTPKDGLSPEQVAPIINYQRLLSLSQYYHDQTETPIDPSSDNYLGRDSLKGDISTTAYFISDPIVENRGKIIITPIATD